MGLRDWLDLILAAAAVFTVLRSWRLLKSDAIQSDATAAKGYMEAAQIAAGQVVDTQKELIEWKARVERLEQALEIKDKRIDELEAAGREKDQKIQALQCEVDELREKIKQLEEKK